MFGLAVDSTAGFPHPVEWDGLADRFGEVSELLRRAVQIHDSVSSLLPRLQEEFECLLTVSLDPRAGRRCVLVVGGWDLDGWVGVGRRPPGSRK